MDVCLILLGLIKIAELDLTCRMYEQHGILTIAYNTPILLAYQNKKEDGPAWELHIAK